MSSEVVDLFQRVKARCKLNFDLKPCQISGIAALLEGTNVFGLLPTGFGKSMLYILPPLLLEEKSGVKKTALVVSPLKSLMLDQVTQLWDWGIPAVAITAHDFTQQSITPELRACEYSVIFISPEAALSKVGKQLLGSTTYQNRVCLLAFDEAHCITKWGQEFRKSYLEVGNLRSELHGCPILACTATATKEVEVSVRQVLGLDGDCTLTVSELCNRPNVFIDIRKGSHDPDQELVWLADKLKEDGILMPKTIVYCRHTTTTSKVWAFLADELGDDSSLVEMYHASNTAEQQQRVLEEFPKKDSSIRCLVSTVAFGMGVQIPDVRLVVHFGAPNDLMSYQQESGRCARDGQAGVALMLAYPMSYSSLVCSETMRGVVITPERCYRAAVLAHLTPRSVAKYTPPAACSGCEQVVCTCSACKCCSYCLSTCACAHKVGKNLEDVFKHI